MDAVWIDGIGSPAGQGTRDSARERGPATCAEAFPVSSHGGREALPRWCATHASRNHIERLGAVLVSYGADAMPMGVDLRVGLCRYTGMAWHSVWQNRGAES